MAALSLAERQNIISTMIAEREKQDPIALKEATNRNLIFVGKTRSGKSTVYKILKSPYEITKHGSMFSGTVDPQITHFTVERKLDYDAPMNYNIGIIDTPGLFEVRAEGDGEARDTELLEELIMRCLSIEITKIHAIFFVFQRAPNINPQDIASLRRFIEFFKGATEHIHLLVTFCEDLDGAEQKKLMDQYRGTPGFNELLSETSDNFLFSGASTEEHYEQGFDSLIALQTDRILEMRKRIFDVIFKAQPFCIEELPTCERIRGETLLLFKNLRERFPQKDSFPTADFLDFEKQVKKLALFIAILDGEPRTHAVKFVNDANAFIQLKRGTELLAKLKPIDPASVQPQEVPELRTDCIALVAASRLFQDGSEEKQDATNVLTRLSSIVSLEQ